MQKSWSFLKFVKPVHVIIIALIVFTIIAFSTTGGGWNGEYDALFTVSSFVFGILIAFMISDRYDRIKNIKRLIAQEAGDLTSIYEFSKCLGEKNLKNITNAIDDYITNSLDYLLEDYITYTSDKFYGILREIEKIKIGKINEIQSNAIGKIFDNFSNIVLIRKEIYTTVHDSLKKFMWIILLVLSSIILFILFISKNNTLFSNLSIILMSTSIVMLLAMLNSLDKLTWSQEEWSWEPYERVFDRMKKLRYYPKPVIGKLITPPEDKQYRLATYTEQYPSNRKTVKIISPKRN